ncbi:hypothetical protein [Demequina lutea]|uniref:Uncharacterized protein n=1 Tax=Demequina lutea TaxID=431489 RepID=A0A7Y9Z9P0_9MICO|nr:hypothetical protein [Demequina lutea]NYI40578.1 hypothetical protein [Demequina lutea]
MQTSSSSLTKDTAANTTPWRSTCVPLCYENRIPELQLVNENFSDEPDALPVGRHPTFIHGVTANDQRRPPATGHMAG